jgi:hypothetical protein
MGREGKGKRDSVGSVVLVVLVDLERREGFFRFDRVGVFGGLLFFFLCGLSWAWICAWRERTTRGMKSGRGLVHLLAH